MPSKLPDGFSTFRTYKTEEEASRILAVLDTFHMCKPSGLRVFDGGELPANSFRGRWQLIWLESYTTHSNTVREMENCADDYKKGWDACEAKFAAEAARTAAVAEDAALQARYRKAKSLVRKGYANIRVRPQYGIVKSGRSGDIFLDDIGEVDYSVRTYGSVAILYTVTYEECRELLPLAIAEFGKSV